MSDYEGNVILLDLSATWCGPCQAEASPAESLYQEYNDGGFVVITVLTDNDITTGDCGIWAGTFGLTFPVLADISLSVWNKYDEEGAVPLNLVIDKDFVIRYKEVGYNEFEIRAIIEEYI